MNKGRNWFFTLNNPELEADKAQLLSLYDGKVKYVKFQLEKGEKSGTIHYQGTMVMKNACRLKTMKKIHPRANWSQCRNLQHCLDYCGKQQTREDGPWEAGTIPPGQGYRTDLMEMCDSIVAGEVTVDEITLDDPMSFHQYGRTLQKVEDLALRKKYRTWMTEGEWLYGPTGVGKSHQAFKDFTPETHYVWKDGDAGWQDGYTGQEIVIINDFRGSIKYGELLQLVDKWPHSVPRRGREPAPFLAKKVIITSSMEPSEVYSTLSETDSLKQLYRRFKVTHLLTKHV